MPDSYSSDRAQADRSLLEQITFVYGNLRYLSGCRKLGMQPSDASRLFDKLSKGFKTAEWERGIVDVMYEVVISAKFRFPKIGRHHDRRTR